MLFLFYLFLILLEIDFSKKDLSFCIVYYSYIRGGKIINKKITTYLISVLLMATSAPIVTCMKNNNIHILSSNPIKYSSQYNWIEIQKLTAIEGTIDDHFGYSVSIDGDTALIGAYGDDYHKGSAYIFTRSENTWTQQTKLSAIDGNQYDYFGLSVSIDGDIALIGAVGDDYHKGSAYIFTRSENTWTQQIKLTAIDGTAYDRFGYSVSIDGDSVIIGSESDDEHKGSAYIFTCTENTWTQQIKLTVFEGVAFDYFSNSVSISGDTALIAAFGDDEYKGSAYIFTCNENIWTQQIKLIATDGIEDDSFGYSVSISGDTVLIGAYGDDECKGSAYVFTKNNPPEKPTCRYDKKNNELRVCSTDIDGNLIRYGISWNYDQSVDQWTEFYNSGEEVSVNCKVNKGSIGVIVEDVYGSLSEWVLIKSKNKTINNPLYLQKFIQHFPFFEKILNQYYNKKT